MEKEGSSETTLNTYQNIRPRNPEPKPMRKRDKKVWVLVYVTELYQLHWLHVQKGMDTVITATHVARNSDNMGICLQGPKTTSHRQEIRLPPRSKPRNF